MGYQFASEAAAEAAQEKGYSIEQLAPGSGAGKNVTKADVEKFDGEPALVPGVAAVDAAKPTGERAPGAGIPGPLDMELGGDARQDPIGADPVGVKASSSTALRERDHQEDCPAIDGDADLEREGSAVESYTINKPAIKGPDGSVVVATQRVRVSRCVECGGQRVQDVDDE